MAERTVGHDLPPRLLTLVDVAALTGRSRRSLSRDVRAGKLRVVRLGRHVRVSQAEYARYVQSGSPPDAVGGLA